MEGTQLFEESGGKEGHLREQHVRSQQRKKALRAADASGAPCYIASALRPPVPATLCWAGTGSSKPPPAGSRPPQAPQRPSASSIVPQVQPACQGYRCPLRRPSAAVHRSLPAFRLTSLEVLCIILRNYPAA